MPYFETNGTRMHYTDTGTGDVAIVFSHGLLFDTRMFDAQVAYFKNRFRCIAFDHRGQGQSGVPETGYDMDTLSEDAAALIRHLGVDKCHFVGLSMGGFVAQRLAINHPDLLLTVSILDSSAEAEPEENLSGYKILNFLLRWIGPWAVSGSVMPIMFSDDFLKDATRKAEKKLWRKRLSAGSKTGLSRAVTGVLERGGVEGRLSQITTPTLVLVGEKDTATVPAKSERIHQAIAGSKLVRIASAGHLSPIEQPGAVNRALSAHIEP